MKIEWQALGESYSPIEQQQIEQALQTILDKQGVSGILDVAASVCHQQGDEQMTSKAYFLELSHRLRSEAHNLRQSP